MRDYLDIIWVKLAVKSEKSFKALPRCLLLKTEIKSQVKNMKSKLAMFAIIAVLGLAFVASIGSIQSASASDDAEITATPDDSNIFNVTGTDFDDSDDVTLELINDDGDTVYTFEEDITTDANGTFTAIVIVPTSTDGGDYTLTASTDDSSATLDITVPDLTGATGATGATGSTGATGAKGTDGADGQDADPALTYGSIGVGALALLIAIVAIMKKPSA